MTSNHKFRAAAILPSLTTGSVLSLCLTSTQVPCIKNTTLLTVSPTDIGTGNVLAATYLSLEALKSDVVTTACKNPFTTPRRLSSIMSNNKVKTSDTEHNHSHLLTSTPQSRPIEPLPITRKHKRQALTHQAQNALTKQSMAPSTSIDGKHEGACKSFRADSRSSNAPSPTLQGWLAQYRKEDPCSAAGRFQQ